MKSCKELKSLSRITLMGKYGNLMGALIMVVLLPLLIELPFSSLNSPNASLSQRVIFIISEVLIQIVAGLLHLGYTTIFFGLARKQEVSTKQIYYCFRNRSDHFIFGYIMILLSYLVTVSPFLIGFICLKNYGNPITILSLVGLALVSVFLFIIYHLFYGMVPFLLLERNELKFYQCFRESRKLLKGHRCELFCLYLSFIGLTVLEILSIGIGAIFVEPYRNMTFVNYYIELTESGKSAS